jgi:hypothetical protein
VSGAAFALGVRVAALALCDRAFGSRDRDAAVRCLPPFSTPATTVVSTQRAYRGRDVYRKDRPES